MNKVLDTNFENIRFINEIIKRDSQSMLLATFKQVFHDTKQILNNRIVYIFDNYTLHDINHSVRIMEYMYDLIEDINLFNDLEIIILCYSALLHDIGMAVSKEEYEEITNDRYNIEGINYSSFFKIYTNEKLSIQEFVRKYHAVRSSNYVKNILSNILTIPNHFNMNFSEEVALICQSHNEDFDWIENNLTSYEIRGVYSFNPKFCACLLRLGDILDLDDQRTPYVLYKFLKPTGYSEGEWKQHFIVNNYNKIIRSEESYNKKITFIGTCNEPRIHRKLLSYFEWVSIEVKNSVKLLRNSSIKYKLNLSEQLEINIRAQGYTFSDHKMLIDFRAITGLLAGEKLYGNKQFGLRELIQNSIDACNVRLEEENKLYNYDSEYTPLITLILNKLENKVILKDNGIGMTLDIIKNHFLNIGSSYYKSIEYKLKAYSFAPVGNFGIGFLACFMLSDYVKVNTRHLSSSIKYEIDLESNSEHTSITEHKEVQFNGTEISLEYESFYRAFNNDYETLLYFIKKYFVFDNIKFQLINIQDSNKLVIESSILDSINNYSLVNNNDFSEVNVQTINLEQHFTDIKGYFTFYDYYDRIDYDIYDIINTKGPDDCTISDNLVWIFHDIDNLEPVKSDFDPSEFVVENKLQYLKIPILSNSIFNRLKKIVNNDGYIVEELYEFYDKYRISFFTLIVSPNIVDIVELYFKENDRNIGFNFNHLLLTEVFPETYIKKLVNKLSFKGEYIYLAFQDSIDIFKSNKRNKYAVLTSGGYYSGDAHKKNLNYKEVYLKNILLNEQTLDLGYRPNYFDLVNFRINILNENVSPNISRSKIDNSSSYFIRIEFPRKLQQIIVSMLKIPDEDKEVLNEALDYCTKVNMVKNKTDIN